MAFPIIGRGIRSFRTGQRGVTKAERWGSLSLRFLKGAVREGLDEDSLRLIAVCFSVEKLEERRSSVFTIGYEYVFSHIDLLLLVIGVVNTAS